MTLSGHDVRCGLDWRFFGFSVEVCRRSRMAKFRAWPLVVLVEPA